MNSSFYKCRLCLKLGEFCSIFEQDESIKLSDMVISFAKIQIFEGDGLPDRVCNSCVENLSSAYLFKLQCERIDEMLRTSTGIEGDNKVKTDNDAILNNDIHIHTANVASYVSHDRNQAASVSSTEQNFDTDIPKGRDNIEESDSDVDSIKCVYCEQLYNSLGVHTCHVTCTIEHNDNSTGSDETLVAAEMDSQYFTANSTINQGTYQCDISCVLCDEKYDKYDDYVHHINACTANVKLHYFVCPLCHEINTEKEAYLQHVNTVHFKENIKPHLTGDCVDTVDFAAVKRQQAKPVRRQIGWSIEDIYQEIDVVENKTTPTSSPIKSFFARLGNETFSRHSTPSKLSFRKLIEDSKTKTSVYLPFKKYINNYKMKKKEALYSPVIPKSKRIAQLKISDTISDSDYGTPSNTSEDSWKLKQNLICACDKKVFMLSEHLENRTKLVFIITSLGGVIAENTKMEMLATHFVGVLPEDSYTGMMVCALATGKWLLHVNYLYDSLRGKRFLSEKLYEWTKHPKILEVDNTSVELAKAASYWHHELHKPNSKMPFEGTQVVLIMKKKYRQYYQMVFKTLKAKAVAYDPRTPGSCCTADYCFVDMRVIERVKLNFFSNHNIPVFPYQYILVFLLNRGCSRDDHKYLLLDWHKVETTDTVDFINKTF